LKSRRIPKRAAVYPVYANPEMQEPLIQRFFGAGTAEERRRVEDQLTAALAEVIGEEVPVLLYCPAAKMQLKQARMLVRWPGESELAPLSQYSQHVPRLADLENSYQRMWKFYVLALTSNKDHLSKLGELAAEFFPGTTNVLVPRDQDPDLLVMQ